MALLGLVWLTAMTSALVFTEPSPTDALTFALIVLLPLTGLVRITPALSLFMTLWTGAAAFALVSSLAAIDLGRALSHTAISIYLYLAMFTFAAFVAFKPEAHARLIFNGLTAGAILAAAAAIAGYFSLIPGAELFTKFGRATGTFKDPNVFGPFLVAPLLFMVHLVLNQPLARAGKPLLAATFFAIAIFLSFSRGAWLTAAIATGIYLVLALLTAKSLAARQKIAIVTLFGVGFFIVALLAALQIDQISALLTERASLSQDYDIGPEGRFGGQEKAIGLILGNPFGIGAGQFTIFHHHEEVHNVYLSMALNAGWFGAAFYILAVGATLIAGARAAVTRNAAQPFAVIAFATFAANVLEGVIIDSDHWRHFYLMMAVIWGIATEQRAAVDQYVSLRRPSLVRRRGRLIQANPQPNSQANP